ncbi:MAG: sugar transferase [Actinomycetota bacterium]
MFQRTRKPGTGNLRHNRAVGLQARRRLIALLDFLGALGAGGLALFILESSKVDHNAATRWARLAGFACLFVFFNAVFDGYDSRSIGSLSSRRIFLSSAVTSLVAFGTRLAPLGFGLLPVITMLLALIVGSLLAVSLYRAISGVLIRPHKVLIAGVGPTAIAAVDGIRSVPRETFSIVGCIRGPGDDKESRRDWDALANAVAPVLGNWDDLTRVVADHGVTMIVLAQDARLSGRYPSELVRCVASGIRVIPFARIYERLTYRVPVDYLGEHLLDDDTLNHITSSLFRAAMKRTIDVVLSSAGLIFLGIATPLIVAAIKIDSPGPAFYTQERVGKNGRIFRVYKFRSMRADAENGKAVWASENDLRVTRVGRVLRKTHVDEFPQFLNILKGEMAAVGPRPERPEFVENLSKEIPLYDLRHALKPGMAGWGLVKQGYGASFEDALEKLGYDLYYIRHQTTWLDAVILLKTIVDTLTFGGR